jgi:hypothetical protein
MGQKAMRSRSGTHQSGKNRHVIENVLEATAVEVLKTRKKRIAKVFQKILLISQQYSSEAKMKRWIRRTSKPDVSMEARIQYCM